jgi:hypothetical protein
VQVPQLYLLAVEACRLLGLPTTPQLHVKSSSEAAAYFLLLPGHAALHGLNGGLPPDDAASAAGSPLPDGAACVVSSSGSSCRGLDGGSTLTGAGSSAGGVRLGYEPPCDEAASGYVCGAERRDWQCALVLTSGLVDLLEPAELQAVLAGLLGFLAAATAAPGSDGSGGDAVQLRRGVAALATLGALCHLDPPTLASRLPASMAPFFHSYICPVLRRCLRYLAPLADRAAAAAAGSWRPVAAAIVKQAAGAATLRDELSLDAVVQQAAALDDAAAELLPGAVLHEDSATVAAAAPSLAVLRVRHLQKWAASALH